MPYANFDDNYGECEKNDALSDGAYRLHTNGILYCCKNKTNGFVRSERVQRLVPKFRPAHLTELLESHPEKPHWFQVPGGYNIRDFLQWNKSAEWWEEKRAKDAKRLAEWRAVNKQTGQQDGEHEQ